MVQIHVHLIILLRVDKEFYAAFVNLFGTVIILLYRGSWLGK